ncbi:MAG: beta-hydroxyacyl-ACP dehydratase [Pirellulaceae bacterium]|nr:beta-hydroxyacyl-ACP dehydratase [Pirellulaceae bacterium]
MSNTAVWATVDTVYIQALAASQTILGGVRNDFQIAMRFRQIDKITLLIPGERIMAEKRLTGDEDYLRDHFPRFPVQPGVMMLESLFQAAQFLVRATEDYRTGLVVLREARNIKFAAFLQPGDTLKVEAQIIKSEGSRTTLKVSGTNPSGAVCVAGRLVVECQRADPPSPSDGYSSQYIRQIIQQLQQSPMSPKNPGYNLADSVGPC